MTEDLDIRPPNLDSIPLAPAVVPVDPPNALDIKAFQSLSRNELRVLYVLRDFMAERNGQAWPSVERIANLCALSPRSVIRITAALSEKAGIGKWRHGRKTYYSIPRFVKRKPPGCHLKILDMKNQNT